MRSGLTLTGFGACSDVFRKLDMQLVNIAARRITGVSRSAGRPVLHAAAGLVSAPNLFLRQCTLIMDRALRADAGPLKVMLFCLDGSSIYILFHQAFSYLN